MTTQELLNQKKTNEDEENSAVTAYKRNNLHIESKIKLVEALYEGILTFNRNTAKAIQEGDVEAKIQWLNRTGDIFAELISALDKKAEGTISEYLEGLYSHQIQVLFEVNRNDDLEKLENVTNVVRGLLDAWREETGINSAKTKEKEAE
jgi:flagellar protein FliS